MPPAIDSDHGNSRTTASLQNGTLKKGTFDAGIVGHSTRQITAKGRGRAMANLVQYRRKDHTPKKRAGASWGTAIDYAVYLSHDTSIRGRCHGCD